MTLEHVPERAIALFAHPDDPDFICGGTIAQWTAAGTHMTYVIMTDGRAGDMGLRDAEHQISAEELVAQRQREQLAAAEVLGVADVIFLNHRDGELQHTLELRMELARIIRRVKPDTAVLFDPQRRFMAGYIQHPDHWISGEAALAAIFPLAGTPRAGVEMLDEGLEAHNVRELYLVASLEPNLIVDISTTIERKIEAMRCHVSQVQDPERSATFIRSMSALVAEGTDFAYAEAFTRITIGARDFRPESED